MTTTTYPPGPGDPARRTVTAPRSGAGAHRGAATVAAVALYLVLILPLLLAGQ